MLSVFGNRCEDGRCIQVSEIVCKHRKGAEA